jgi:hypothetical protein
MFWSTTSFLLIASIYPLSLLEHSRSSSVALRILTSTQLIGATFGSILCLIFTLFLWYAALTGLYHVDIFNGL